MTPYSDDIFRELKALLAEAEPEQIERLLSDIATGQFSATAQTRAGANDDLANVTNIEEPILQRQQEAVATARLAVERGRALRDDIADQMQKKLRGGYAS